MLNNVKTCETSWPSALRQSFEGQAFGAPVTRARFVLQHHHEAAAVAESRKRGRGDEKHVRPAMTPRFFGELMREGFGLERGLLAVLGRRQEKEHRSRVRGLEKLAPSSPANTALPATPGVLVLVRAPE